MWFEPINFTTAMKLISIEREAPMKGSVCTLYEGDYHYGLAALVNTLHGQGYFGKVYIGYRGQLPEWAQSAVHERHLFWGDVFVLETKRALSLIFLKLNTTYHLANYKADFMLDLFETYSEQLDYLYYLDPDICISRSWVYFEDWVRCGIAVCEDVNSPYPKNHPSRIGWRLHFNREGLNLNFKFPEYANSGLVGVPREYRGFLNIWKDLQVSMGSEIGGLDVTKLTRGKPFLSKGFANCFEAPDQDALNAAFEAANLPVSMIGKEAMGFKPGAGCALHALGSNKPWRRSYFIELFRGYSPRMVDKLFWSSMSGPLRPYSNAKIFLKRLEIFLATFMGRFYRKPF